MWKKIVSMLLLVFIILTSVNSYVYAKEKISGMYAKAYVLMDGSNGRTLLGKNENMLLANASTTKILTCILALEKGNLDEIVTVSENAVAQPKVHLGMQKGEQFLLKDLLYAMMLESYNDCAVAIAEAISGSVEEFCLCMNDKALEIGCENTYFVTPNGLDATRDNTEHHTTALDLCKIMKYCAWDSSASEQFLSITECRSYDFCDLDGKRFRCINRNRLLDEMNGLISGKTGFTAKAGYCYICAYEKDGKKFCVALLACGWPNHKDYKWSDAKKLISYGMEKYTIKKINYKNSYERILICNGKKDLTLSDYYEAIYINPVAVFPNEWSTLLVCEEDVIRLEVNQEKIINAPIVKNQIVGELQVYINDKVLYRIPLISNENIEKWSILDLGKCIIKDYTL